MTQYAVACAMNKTEGNQYVNSITLHVVDADNIEAAKGIAVTRALDLKLGFAVWEVLVTETKP